MRTCWLGTLGLAKHLRGNVSSAHLRDCTLVILPKGSTRRQVELHSPAFCALAKIAVSTYEVHQLD